jgi:hypothetical protein
MKHSGTPGPADKLVKYLKALFNWAISAELVTFNPATGVTKINKSRGFHTWSEAELEGYRAAYPFCSMARFAMGRMLICQNTSVMALERRPRRFLPRSARLNISGWQSLAGLIPRWRSAITKPPNPSGSLMPVERRKTYVVRKSNPLSPDRSSSEPNRGKMRNNVHKQKWWTRRDSRPVWLPTMHAASAKMPKSGPDRSGPAPFSSGCSRGSPSLLDRRRELGRGYRR